MIFHITDQARWARSLAEGQHTGSSRDLELADEGFIHCSTAAQWRGVLARYYGGATDLLMLTIDEQRLTSPLRYEAAAEGAEAFPHVYGPINLDAVVAIEPIIPAT